MYQVFDESELEIYDVGKDTHLRKETTLLSVLDFGAVLSNNAIHRQIIFTQASHLAISFCILEPVPAPPPADVA